MMKSTLPIATLTAGLISAQPQCQFYLADQTAANQGFALHLEAQGDSKGSCQLSSVSLVLTVGDGAGYHKVTANPAWQTGAVYTAKAVITAAGPQQLSLNGQASGSSAGLASNITSAPAVAAAPGIFPVILNGISYAAGVFLDGKIVGDPLASPAFRKAKPGDAIELFATGLALSPAGVQPVPARVSGVTVTIGGITVPADFAGLVAAGEFQINFKVPEQFTTMPEANYPITISVNGVSSPSTINSDPAAQLVIPIQH